MSTKESKYRVQRRVDGSYFAEEAYMDYPEDGKVGIKLWREFMDLSNCLTLADALTTLKMEVTKPSTVAELDADGNEI